MDDTPRVRKAVQDKVVAAVLGHLRYESDSMNTARPVATKQLPKDSPEASLLSGLIANKQRILGDMFDGI